MASPSSTSKPDSHAQQETVAQSSAREAFTAGPLCVSAIRRTMDGQKWLRIVSKKDGIERAYVPFGDRTAAEYKQCMSDARLYAAAPDMLAALQKAEKLFAILEHDNQLGGDGVDLCRAAISKALSIQPPSSVAHGVVTSEPMKVKP